MMLFIRLLDYEDELSLVKARLEFDYGCIFTITVLGVGDEFPVGTIFPLCRRSGTTTTTPRSDEFIRTSLPLIFLLMIKYNLIDSG
ncbi:hypothetical protein [Thermococcus sibiricus]|uniref:Uncharacterized protein n=1 Tax=Thermococcus sibiricus TaxID=172049 RepID=A0A101EME3_9EURY|nr:hypothetical protein [Thermococcus sibiricus]KUK18027.1 MAG: hypothetical protein XD54_0643 [Thermococcus sibiricus]